MAGLNMPITGTAIDAIMPCHTVSEFYVSDVLLTYGNKTIRSFKLYIILFEKMFNMSSIVLHTYYNS